MLNNMTTGDTNEIKIRAKKISSIDQLPDNYLNDNNADNSYMLIAYNNGSDPGYNYKVAISQIMGQIENNVLEHPEIYGDDAYQIAQKEQGFTGTVDEWLASLKGVQGEKGDKGERGEDGLRGADGKSAYDIAVEHGYTGSEDDWYNDIMGGVNTTALEALRTELMNLINDYHATRTIVYDLQHITANPNNINSFVGKNPITLLFSPNTGYNMPDENFVFVNGAEFTYDKNQKTLILREYTSQTITVTIITNDKIKCLFNTSSFDNNKLSVSLSEGINNEFYIDDEFEVQINVNTDGYTYPTDITCTGCIKVSYNNTTGIARLKCTGTNTQMTINGKAKDIKPYIFSYALKRNSNVFILDQYLEIVDVHWDYVDTLPYTIKTTGTSVINYTTGITWDSSVNVEREDVWMILPKKYYNMANDTFNDDNGNKYMLLDVFGRKVDLLQPPKVITYNNIEYILYFVSNNGSTNTQLFQKI